MLIILLATAIAPGIAISLLVYSMHAYGKEYRRPLIVAFLLGMAATIPPLVIQWLARDVRDNPGRHSILEFAWFAFVIVALSEEGSKYLLLRYYAYPRAEFEEAFDGILFSVMIGMGFATVENIEYVWKFGLETGFSRFFLAVPAHASFAVLMGYNAGRAKAAAREDGGLLRKEVAGRSRSLFLLWKGLLIAVFFHGSFDFFLFLKQKSSALPYTGILSFGSFASFYIAVRLAMRAIRAHAGEEEEDEHEEDKTEERREND